MLEICATNLASCIIAEQGGAVRVELCEGLAVGGITPDLKLVEEVRSKISIDLYVLIRCREGNFVYSNDEIDLMIDSIYQSKRINVNGIVLGCLNNDGTMDNENCKRMIAAAYPMKITFHRAFDAAKNPSKALEEIIDLGCERLLTSGQKETAFEGKELIASLVNQANQRISIMPGAGIDERNVYEIGKATGAKEFHGSLKRKNTNDLDKEVIELNRIREVVNQMKRLNEK